MAVWQAFSYIRITGIGCSIYLASVALLTLQFDDFEEPESGVKLMNEEQAAQIIAFLRQYQNVDTMLIHCFAGKSRSAAVGKFAAELYGVPEPECPYYNTWVYGILRRVHEKSQANIYIMFKFLNMIYAIMKSSKSRPLPERSILC